jgi:hypothetical protein
VTAVPKVDGSALAGACNTRLGCCTGGDLDVLELDVQLRWSTMHGRVVAPQ